MDQGLKPCPFCGGKAQIEHYLFSWSIYCACGAQMTICGCGKDEGQYVMDAWNSRYDDKARDALAKWSGE